MTIIRHLPLILISTYSSKYFTSICSSQVPKIWTSFGATGTCLKDERATPLRFLVHRWFSPWSQLHPHFYGKFFQLHVLSIKRSRWLRHYCGCAFEVFHNFLACPEVVLREWLTFLQRGYEVPSCSDGRALLFFHCILNLFQCCFGVSLKRKVSVWGTRSVAIWVSWRRSRSLFTFSSVHREQLFITVHWWTQSYKVRTGMNPSNLLFTTLIVAEITSVHILVEAQLMQKITTDDPQFAIDSMRWTVTFILYVVRRAKESSTLQSTQQIQPDFFVSLLSRHLVKMLCANTFYRWFASNISYFFSSEDAHLGHTLLHHEW